VIAGTLDVDGAGEFNSTLGADGNFRVGSTGASNFTVTAASGNTSIGGTLDVTSTTTLNDNATVKNGKQLKFEEAGGANYTAFKAGTQSVDLEYTLPTSAPTSTNKVLTATAFANPMTLAWSNPNAEVIYGVDNTTAWGGNQDNVTVPSEKAIMRISSTLDVNLSGLNATGIANGRIIVLVNVGANDITIKHNNSSTAGNEFKLPGGADIVLAPDGSATLMYDTTSAVWRVLSVN
jgi:hypothetical protein